MTDRNVDIQRLSPDKLLARFGKVPLMPFLLLGFILHVVIVGGTSVPYVMSLINPQPEPPPAPPAATAPVEKSETGSASSGSSSGGPAATTAAAGTSSSGGPEAATASSSGATGTPANVKNTEYLKSLNETAPPPKEPISGKELDDRLKME